jgi:N-acetylneuraminic acid mutarotase
MPTARSALAVTGAPDGRIYALGGWNGGGVFGFTYSTLEIYSPATNSWATAAPMPTARNLHAVAADAHHLYALGGFAGNNDPPLTTLEIYDIAANTWKAGAPMPTARGSLCAVMGPDGRVYAIGGGNDGYPDGNYVEFAAVEAYSPSTDHWTTVAPLPIARDRLACAVGADGRIYAIAGCAGVCESNVVEAYDVHSNTWTTLASTPEKLQNLAAVAGPNGKIYAIGGMSDLQYEAIVYAYDPASNSWALDSGLGVAREALGAAVGGDSRMYAIGGYDGHVLPTVEAQNSIGVWVP